MLQYSSMAFQFIRRRVFSPARVGLWLGNNLNSRLLNRNLCEQKVASKIDWSDNGWNVASGRDSHQIKWIEKLFRDSMPASQAIIIHHGESVCPTGWTAGGFLEFIYEWTDGSSVPPHSESSASMKALCPYFYLLKIIENSLFLSPCNF